MTEWAAGLAGAVTGGVVAWVTGRALVRARPVRLLRTNVHGAEVPAVLGAALVLGGCVGAVATLITLSLTGGGAPARMFGALWVVLVLLGLAGLWDDLRGDERARGFRGHLGALGGRRLTGGLVKILAGAVAGLIAGSLVAEEITRIVGIGMVVALTANLVNLFDRAPGRAGKVAFLGSICAALIAPSTWLLTGGGLLAALLVLLPWDLSARGMLGDQGANPLGAAIGLGLGAGTEGAAQAVLVALLLAANLASERWSFSMAIERVPYLRAADRWGRMRPDRRDELPK